MEPTKMKIKNISAIYAISVGVSMLGMWIMFFLTNNIPELKTEPLRIGMHLLAEIITAIMLIICGVFLLRDKERAFGLYLISVGMLLYTLIASSGYFLQIGDYGFVLMFGILIVITVILIVLSRKDIKYE